MFCLENQLTKFSGMKISACILFNYSVPSPETFPIKENNNLDLSELTERIFN